MIDGCPSTPGGCLPGGGVINPGGGVINPAVVVNPGAVVLPGPGETAGNAEPLPAGWGDAEAAKPEVPAQGYFDYDEGWFD